MIAVSVKNYRKPQYPDKIEFEAQPELLHKNIPPAWKGIAAMSALVPLFLSACQSTPEKKAALVVPIFEHGTGHATIGCVVSSPPVFLSEEEALSVIKEELDRAGIDTSSKNQVLHGVRAERKVYSPRLFPKKEDNGKHDSSIFVPVVANFMDKIRRIAVSYVSCKNEKYYADEEFAYEHEMKLSTIKSYDYMRAAQKIVNAERLEESDSQISVAAFYNPAYPDYLYKHQDRPLNETELKQERDEQNKWRAASQEYRVSESKRLLRAQVKDFVDWLKAQGAI